MREMREMREIIVGHHAHAIPVCTGHAKSAPAIGIKRPLLPYQVAERHDSRPPIQAFARIAKGAGRPRDEMSQRPEYARKRLCGTVSG